MGWTALHYAARDESAVSVHSLVDAGYAVTARDVELKTPLHIAAQSDNEPAVRVLLQAQARVDTSDVDGWPPVHVAAYAGHVDILRLLLEAARDTRAAVSSVHAYTLKVRDMLAQTCALPWACDGACVVGSVGVGFVAVRALLCCACLQLHATDNRGATSIVTCLRMCCRLWFVSLLR